MLLFLFPHTVIVNTQTSLIPFHKNNHWPLDHEQMFSFFQTQSKVASHPAATSCVAACRGDEDDLLKFELSIRTGMELDFSVWMWRGGWRQMGWADTLLICRDFHSQPSSRITECCFYRKMGQLVYSSSHDIVWVAHSSPVNKVCILWVVPN